MKIIFFLLTILGFKKTYLKYNPENDKFSYELFKKFLPVKKFDHNLLYGVSFDDIVTYSLFNKIFFSFPIKFNFIYYNYYNPPDMIGGFRSQLPEYYKYSQRLIYSSQKYKPDYISYQNENKKVVYIN